MNMSTLFYLSLNLLDNPQECYAYCLKVSRQSRLETQSLILKTTWNLRIKNQGSGFEAVTKLSIQKQKNPNLLSLFPKYNRKFLRNVKILSGKF